jgi:hypothetical protein
MKPIPKRTAAARVQAFDDFNHLVSYTLPFGNGSARWLRRRYEDCARTEKPAALGFGEVVFGLHVVAHGFKSEHNLKANARNNYNVILRGPRVARASKDACRGASAVALRGSLRSHLRVTE